MHFVYNGVFLIAGFFWGKWKKWRLYYSTILFFIAVDLFANYLIYNHHLWTYQETIFTGGILVNHTIITLMVMLITYPMTIFLYLGLFPTKRWKQVGWILLWVALYSTVEYINVHFLSLMVHSNGWTMYWSVLFNLVMFPTLRIHYKNPPLAWLISAIWTIIIFLYFKIPIESMK